MDTRACKGGKSNGKHGKVLVFTFHSKTGSDKAEMPLGHIRYRCESFWKGHCGDACVYVITGGPRATGMFTL